MPKKRAKTIEPTNKKVDEKAAAKRDIIAGKLVFYAFGFSGCAALIYEVLWTRELSLVFGSTVYAVSTMLTAFMAGLSFGSYFGGKFADRLRNLVFLFGAFELGIGIFGLLSIPLIGSLPVLYFFLYNNLSLSFYSYHIIQFVLCFLIMIIPTSLMGATFPVVSKIHANNLKELGQDVGGVYAINTVGAIIGSFLPGFVLIPAMGMKATTIAAAGINLTVAAVLIMISGRRAKSAIIGTSVLVFLIMSIINFLWNDRSLAFNWSMLKDYPDYASFKSFQEDAKPIYFGEDSHGTVGVYKSSDGSMFLFNGGRIEGGNRGIDIQTTALLTYLPIISASDPQSILVIGLGTGNTLKEAEKFPLKKIVCAEIVKKVVPAAKKFVGEEVFEDSRLKLEIADARNYLYVTPEKFDVITSEPSHPMHTSITNLFTLDFYELAKSRLTDDGVFAQWVPRYLLRRDDFIFMLKTFKEAFPYITVWASYENEQQALEKSYPTETIFIGSFKPLAKTADEIRMAIDKEAQKSGIKLLYGPYLTSEQVNMALESYGADAPINTDDKPILEFIIPRNMIEFAYQGSQE